MPCTNNKLIARIAALLNNNFIKSIFFGNYFYGFCAIALSIEASLQQYFPINNFFYYIFIYSVTVVYYTKAYISVAPTATKNSRLIWYSKNRNFINHSQQFFILLTLFIVLLFLKSYCGKIFHLSFFEYFSALIFPLAAALYYGIGNNTFGKYNLRSIGWLKPFVIGFTWAGIVTVYPVLFYHVINNLKYQLTLLSCLLLLKNFMFISLLCIMFDIKDYADDYNQRIKTFVHKFGLRKTIFYILIPLSVIGLGSFIFYGISHNFSLMKIVLNMVPFILLISVAYSLHNRKSILYYLIIIDGLMLIKAICGITAMKLF